VFVHRLANRLTDRGHDVTIFTFGVRPDDARYRVTKAGSAWLGQRVARLTLAPLVLNRLPQARFDVLHLHGDDWFFLPRRVATVRTFYGSALFESRTATTMRRRASQAVVYPLEIVASRLATASFDIGSELPRGYRTDGSLALAVNPAADSCRSKPRDRPTVLFVGTWHGRKRGKFLADVFERLVIPRHPTAELLMVSDHCAERPGVTWIRFPSDEVLASLYRSAWVFCLPSTYEGFGLPYLEALTHDVPVVATPNAGSRHLLAQGAGLLVEDAGLGAAVSQLLGDPEARARLAEAGRARVRDFSWSRVVEEHEAAYALAQARFGRGF